MRGAGASGHRPGAPYRPLALSFSPTLLFLLPAVLNFFLDNRWGFNRDRLAISKDQRAVRSVPGIPMLFAAERLMTSCHLSIDLVIGDVAITQGKSYWACCVDPSSYLVKVGVGLESKLQEWFQVPQDVVSPR